MKIALVYTERSSLLLDKPFSYFVRDDLKIQKGVRVNIPFNKQLLVGYVEDIVELDCSKEEYENKVGYELKEITEVIDDEPLLNNELINLAHYLATSNVASVISCYQTMLPSSLKPTSGEKTDKLFYKTIRIIDENTDGLSDKLATLLNNLKGKETYLRDIEDNYSIKRLITLKKAEQFEKEVFRDPLNADYVHKDAFELTKDQKNVFNEINASNEQVYLLEGVTGSGKTEIYLQLAEQELKRGKTVLFLVPEISLTPLTIKRVKERLDYPVAVLHSGLSNGERYDEYRRIKSGEAKVVVGARTAIFAPLDNLGLIIVDEEHSESYKEENAPCYKLIDVAIQRANYHKCKIILGSATPSLESKTNAVIGRYHQLYLPKRINEQLLPEVSVVNMIDEMKNRNYSILSRQLRTEIQKCIDNNEQIILLLNRRGYSTSLQCSSCGYTFRCEKCKTVLHYHSDDNLLKCHYCGRSYPKLDNCPRCGSKYIRHLGAGSQKLEETISKEIKNAKVLRMDLDSVSKKGQLEQKLQDFEDQKYNIMLGTQIISKGLDFNNVSLVGVINADSLLYNGDFRSGEKTYQLLAQVVGRCGRGNKRGKAIIQTSSNNSYILEEAAKQDYETFYAKEMAYRKSMALPPYRNIIKLTIGFYNKDKLYAYCTQLKNMINLLNKDEDFELLGPSEPYIKFIANQYRYNFLLKYKDTKKVYELVEEVKKDIVKKGYYVKFDTSPIDN